MGLGTQMVAWQEDFCRELAERGLVRRALRQPRHRALDAHAAARPPNDRPAAARSRRAAALHARATWPTTPPGCCDELELAPAHVIGASMGGMIAQTLAARHPRRVRSLVSIMSNTGSLLQRAARRCGCTRCSCAAPRASARRSSRTCERVFAAIGSRGLPQRHRGHPRARRAELRPRPRPRRARAPAGGDHRLRRPHRASCARSPRPRS